MMKFCLRTGVNINSVRFLFDGDRLNFNSTPDACEMEPGDIIDVVMEQQGD